MRGIAFNLNGYARLGKDRDFRVVREYYHKCGWFGDGSLISKLTFVYSYCVELVRAIQAIDVQFSLVETLETAL
jgi:hypothetical protein